MIGHNSRQDEIQAAILRFKLRCVDSWNEARRDNAQRRNSALSGIEGLVTPRAHTNRHHVYHQYTIRTAKRGELRSRLQGHGIASFVCYPISLRLQKALNHLGYDRGDFPQTRALASRYYPLPVFAEFESGKVDQVTEQIKPFFEATK